MNIWIVHFEVFVFKHHFVFAFCTSKVPSEKTRFANWKDDEKKENPFLRRDFPCDALSGYYKQ